MKHECPGLPNACIWSVFVCFVDQVCVVGGASADRDQSDHAIPPGSTLKCLPAQVCVSGGLNLTVIVPHYSARCGLLHQTAVINKTIAIRNKSACPTRLQMSYLPHGTILTVLSAGCSCLNSCGSTTPARRRSQTHDVCGIVKKQTKQHMFNPAVEQMNQDVGTFSRYMFLQVC